MCGTERAGAPAGDYMSSKMQYVNNDILVECVLMQVRARSTTPTETAARPAERRAARQGFKELRVSCGDMQWVLPGGKQHISPGKTYACEAEDGTTATAHIEVEDFDGDNAGDVAISTLVPPAARARNPGQRRPDPRQDPGPEGSLCAAWQARWRAPPRAAPGGCAGRGRRAAERAPRPPPPGQRAHARGVRTVR